MNDSSSEAIKLYKKQEYRKAANLLKNALQIEPDNFDNNELLGYCYINNYQFDKALEIFKKLFIKRPENMSVHNGIGLSYHGQGKYEQALKVYDMLLAIEPENAFCYFNRSEAFIDMGLFDEAIDSLNAFLILVPGDIIALNNRAYCYLQNNEYARAVDEFSGIIKADNSYPNAFLHRAKAYYNMGNKKQCIYDLRKAYTLGLYKAERFLNEWELPPVQYSLYKAMAFLREKDKESLGKPLKIKNYERFITEFTDIGINVMDDLFWMDYFIHDGLSYDGVELFSIAHDALIEKEFYTLPDIVAQNINFRDRHPDSSKYILLGKTDEDLILYDAEGEEFLLAAREDLLIYQSFSDISVLLSLLWGINIGNYAENKMRNALNNEISEFFKENNFTIEGTLGYLSSSNDSITSIFSTGNKTFYSSSSNYFFSSSENTIIYDTSKTHTVIGIDTLNNQKIISFGFYDASKLTDTYDGGWSFFDRCLGRLIEAEQDSIFNLGVVTEIPSSFDSNLVSLNSFFNINMQRVSYIDTTYADSSTYDGTNSWSLLDAVILYSNSLDIGRKDTSSTDSIMTNVTSILGLDPYNSLKLSIGNVAVLTEDQDSIKITTVDSITADYSDNELVEIYNQTETESVFYIDSLYTDGTSWANFDSATSNYLKQGAINVRSLKKYVTFPMRIVNSWTADGWNIFAKALIYTFRYLTSPPSDLTVTALSTSSLILNWTDNSDGENNYVVYLNDYGNYDGNTEIVSLPAADAVADTLYYFWPPNGKFSFSLAAVKEGDTTQSISATGYTLAEAPLAPETFKVSDTTILYYINARNFYDNFSDTGLDSNPVWDELVGNWSVDSPNFRLTVSTDGGENHIRSSYGPDVVEGFNDGDFSDSTKWSKSGSGGVGFILKDSTASLTGDGFWHEIYQSAANRADSLEPNTYYYLNYEVASNTLAPAGFSFYAAGGNDPNGLYQNYNLEKTVGTHRTLVKTKQDVKTKKISFFIANASSGTIVLDNVSITRAGKDTDLYKDVKYSAQFHFNDSLRLNSQWIEFYPFMVDTSNTYYAFLDSSKALFIVEETGIPDTLIDTTYTGNYKWRTLDIIRDFDGSPVDTTVTWTMLLDSDTLGSVQNKTHMDQKFIGMKASDRRIWFDNFYIKGLTPSANASHTLYALQDSITSKYVYVTDDIDSLGTAEVWYTYEDFGGLTGRYLKVANTDSVYLRLKAKDGEE